MEAVVSMAMICQYEVEVALSQRAKERTASGLPPRFVCKLGMTPIM